MNYLKHLKEILTSHGNYQEKRVTLSLEIPSYFGNPKILITKAIL
jgi:hypothetical protein